MAHRDHQPRGRGRTRRPARLLVIGAFLSALCGPGGFGLVSPAVGQEDGPTKSIAARAGYIGFETFGRSDSIGHVEVLPYTDAGQHTLFSDVRFFVSDEGLFGGNAGVGYRFAVPEWNRFFGGSLWYDVDDTTGDLFHQIGVSFETYGSEWDFRSNLYFPVGDVEKGYESRVENQRFVGNQVLYDGAQRFREAMEGFDLEYGVLLPTEFAARHDVRTTLGGYFFFGDAAEDICGYKVRLEGNVTDNVSMQVEMTDDETFGTNVSLGVAIFFPGGSPCDDSCGPVRLQRRSCEFVRRNYNIIASEQEDLRAGLIAVNPDTGQPYVVQHVSETVVGTTGVLDPGSVENPFQTIAAAQAAGGDVVFVHGDGVFNEPIVLQAGEQILGEGVDHWISYGSYGTALLPTATGSTVRPTIGPVTGTAVTLASNSRFAGFLVDDPTGYGIVGDSVENVEVANVDVVNAGLDGVLLEDVTGSNLFADVEVRDSSGAGISVQSGAGAFSFDNVTVEGSAGGPAVSIVNSNAETSFTDLDVTTENTTGLYARNSGLLTIDDGSIDSTGASAVDVENTEVDVNLTSVSSDGAAAGVRLVDTPGEFTVTGDGADGTGGLIQNATTGVLLDNAGTVNLKYVDLDANDVGIDASNTELLCVKYARITNSLTYGIDSLNTTTLEVYDSTLENNGAAGSNSFRARVDTLGSYEYTFQANAFVDDSDAAISIFSTGGADASSLTVRLQDNEITTTRFGADGVRVDWDGPIVGIFADNDFEGTGGSNDGIDISGNATADIVQFRINGNDFTFSGGNDTGVEVSTAGASFFNIYGNDVTFDESGGVGMDFTLAESAEAYVYQNVITDNVAGGTGIRFSSIAGPSKVAIDANQIDLLSTTGVADNGIVFTSITDTVDLFGTYDNTVNGATTSFFAPVGTTEGHIYVNGEPVP